VRATNEEVRYLLDAANAFFPRARLTTNDVVAAWAGIRPLVPTAGSAGSASREHSIATGPDGVIGITGGKLTTYRIMAAQVVDVALRELGRRADGAASATTPLPGGDVSSIDTLVATIARSTGDVQLAAHLASYGSRWDRVWAECASDGARRVVADLPYTHGELRYAVRQELALTLGDLFIRRTHLAFETRDHGMNDARAAAATVAPLLGWTADEQRRAIDDYEIEVERIFAIR
jgi:glycerol-3-phosphate dehydrogenase